ncbi:MAG: hypothetical protein EXR70_20715 [Deltaproteobacteria bacterium]|nr:hypothetical protein [Deltaproteobacteria bacterium]
MPVKGIIPQTDHYYSNDIAMPAGYAPQDTIGFLRQDSGSDAVALKRFYRSSTGRHYYSTTTDQPSGYSDDGTIGYLDTSSGTGLTALYRHYNSGSGDYLLSTSSTPPNGYTLQATLGYLQSGNSSTNNLVAYIRNPIAQVVQEKTQNVTYSYNYDNAHRVTSVTDSRDYSVFASLRISNHKFQMANYSLHNCLREFGIWNPESGIARRASYSFDPLGNRSTKTAGSTVIGVRPEY